MTVDFQFQTFRGTNKQTCFVFCQRFRLINFMVLILFFVTNRGITWNYLSHLLLRVGFSGSATFRPQDPQTDFVSHGTRIAVPLAWIRSRRLLGWIRHDHGKLENSEMAIFVCSATAMDIHGSSFCCSGLFFFPLRDYSFDVVGNYDLYENQRGFHGVALKL